MAENSLTRARTMQLPAPADLWEPSIVCRVAEDLGAIVHPILEDSRAFASAYGDAEHLAVARRIVAREAPPAMFKLPAALRAAAGAPPDHNQIADRVAEVIDTRTCYRPPDTAAYVLSIIDCLMRRRFSPAVVHRACQRLRETDPAELHHQLPSESHFIDACERAEQGLESLARIVEHTEQVIVKARAIIERSRQAL